MNRLFGDDHEFEEVGERVRREVGDWLSWALSSGVVLPRIPLRRVRDGGFDGMMRTSGGREWSRAWWGDAFSIEALDIEH